MTRQRLKLGLSVAGLVLVVLAFRLEDPRINWAAIVLLSAAVLVRFTGPRAPRDGDSGASGGAGAP